MYSRNRKVPGAFTIFVHIDKYGVNCYNYFIENIKTLNIRLCLVAGEPFLG